MGRERMHSREGSLKNPHGCGLLRCGTTTDLFAIKGPVSGTTAKHNPSGLLQLVAIWLTQLTLPLQPLHFYHTFSLEP
jgi:hypothetical protein